MVSVRNVGFFFLMGRCFKGAVISAELAVNKQGRLWHGPGAPIPVCSHMLHSHNTWGRIKWGSLHDPLLGLGFASGTDLAAAEA